MAMKPALKWTLIILGILLFLGLIIGGFLYFRKSTSIENEPPPAPVTPPADEPCVPFTENQWKIAREECRKKCYPHIFYGGIGFANKCILKCKEKIPPIVEC